MSGLRRILCLYVPALVCALATCPSSTQAAQSMRGYFIGNSLTHRINFWNVDQMAAARGNTFAYGEHCDLGAALHQIWENPNGGDLTYFPYGYFQNALTNYQWDAITFQPYSRPIEGPTGDRAAIQNFINYARVKSPDAQFYIFEQWPIRWSSPLEFDQRWLQPYTGYNDSIRSRDFYEKLTLAAREDFPTLSKPVRLVPVGDVLYNLNQRMHAGLVPGYTDVEQFYRDDQHLYDIGNYLVSLTFYATMYKQDPRGLPYDALLIPDPIVAEQIQEATWQVVRSHPFAGFNEWGPVKRAQVPGLGFPPGTPLPEPTWVGLIALVGATAGARRRRST